MTIEKKEGEEFYPFEIFNKSVIKIYLILAFINERSRLSLPTTSVDIMNEFGTQYKNTNKYIQKLREPKFIKKRKKVNGFDGYFITVKGQDYLNSLSKVLNADKTLRSL